MENIDSLRTILFDTLRALQNKENPMDIYRADAITKTAQAIINSAKVEVDHLKVTGKTQGTGFIPGLNKPEPKAIAHSKGKMGRR